MVVFKIEPEWLSVISLALAGLAYWNGAHAQRVEMPFGTLVGALFGASAALYVFCGFAYATCWATQESVVPHHALLPFCFVHHTTSFVAYVAMRRKERTAVFMLSDEMGMVRVFWTWRGARDVAMTVGEIMEISPLSGKTNLWHLRIRTACEPDEFVYLRIERHYM